MGISEKLGDMADDALRKTGGAEKTKGHISTAADGANSATGGRYEEHVDKAETGAKSAVDKLSKKKNKRKR